MTKTTLAQALLDEANLERERGDLERAMNLIAEACKHMSDELQRASQTSDTGETQTHGSGVEG